MLRLPRLARTVASLSACVIVAVSSLHADLGFTPLAIPASATRGAKATGISADGTTIVGYGTNANFDDQALLWSSAGSVTELGDLPGGSTLSRANAVSADGSVVVGFGTVASGFQEAFRWTAATGLVSLGDIPGGISASTAYAVSSDGTVVVGGGRNATAFGEALRWTAATGSTGIGFLPGGNSSNALGISADGTVIVGDATLPSGLRNAFRYTPAGGLVGIGSFGDGSTAYAANTDGTVVVGSAYRPANYGNEAFRWTAATGLVGLGDLPGGLTRSEAFACSADGSVVVGSAEGANLGDNAFVWDANNGMRSIRALLTAAGLAKNWTITAATGVSADGSKIVGYGSGPNGNQAWLLDFNAPPPPPPPPPTVALVWTEDLPQTVAFKANSVVRLGYDNGTGIIDIATQTGATAGLNGVEYADGLLLVANQGAGTGGTRVHSTRYAPIIVSNLAAYDLHATPGFLWQATGGANRLYKLAQSGGFTTTGTVIDRTFTTLVNRSVSRFTNAVHSDGTTTFFSSTSNPAGLYKRTVETLVGQAAIYTASLLAAYDFEVVGDQIYFTNINANTIQRIKTDGTGLVTLVTDAMFANGIEVTDTHIYWSEFTTGLIRRANLDGTNPVTLIEGRTGLRGVTVLPLSLVDGPAPQGLAFNDLPATYDGASNTPVPLSLASTSGLPVSLEILSGPATVAGNSITYTGAGIVVVRATQAGNASYAPASLTSSVNAAPRLGQTITFAQPADVTYAGTPVVIPLSATASSGLPVGLIVTEGPASYDSVAQALTVTGLGSITVYAVQDGDATYAPADYVVRTFTSSAPVVASPLETYLAAAGVPANQRGPLDDPDADGMSNLLEFALGGAPMTPGGTAIPVCGLLGGDLTLTYTRAQATAVTYEVQTTTDLTNPASWTATGVTQGTPAVNGLTTASIPYDTAPAFLRLQVTLNP